MKKIDLNQLSMSWRGKRKNQNSQERQGKQEAEKTARMDGAYIQHTFSIYSAYIGTCWRPAGKKATSPFRAMRYAAMLLMLLTLGVGQMWAEKYFNIGVAVGNPNNYTVKVGVNCEGWSWYTHDMTKAGLTFEGQKLYLNTINTPDSKTVGKMHFQLYDGETYKEESVAIANWTATDASTFDTKIWNYASNSWYTELSFSTSARFYFDASTWDETTIKLVIGHANYQKYYSLSNITNTKLYYGNSSDTWGDAMHIGVVGGTSASSGENWPSDISDKANEYTGLKNYALSSADAGNVYLMVPAGDAGAEPSMSYYGTHYNTDALNSTQTIKYAVGINGATPTELTSGYVPASIAISSYEFVSGTYNSVSSSSGSVTLSKGGSNYSATVTAARTATTTYTVSNVHEDYSFLGWYSAASGGTLLSSDVSYTFYPTSATTAYARFSKENNHSVTISRYCTSTSTEINNTSAKIGEVTYSEISAPVIYGYTFTGWSYGNGISVKSGDTDTSNPIHVKTLNSGTYTLTANYTEVLTTTFYISGTSSASSPFTGWGASGTAMTKKSGYSTTEIYYCTIDVENVAGDGEFEFKPYNSSGNVHYTNAGYWVTRANHANISCTGADGASLLFKPDIAGRYEFKIDNTGANPVLTVTFPTTYTVNFGVSPAGSANAPTNNKSITNGSSVLSGTEVTFTKQAANTGYTWGHWEKNSSNVGTGNTYDATIDGNTTITAVYTENSYSTTVAVSPAGYGTTSPAAGTHYIKHHTGNSISASSSNSTFYVFKDWSVSGGGLTMTSPETTTPNTFKATSADGTITANFTPKWHIAGGDGDTSDSDDDEMGDWNPYANGILNFGKVNTTQDTGYVNIDLPANSTFKFKVRELGTDNWYGNTGTMNYAANNKQEWTMDEQQSSNCGINTAGKGTYKFSWNMATKKVRVTYPTSHTVTFGYGTGGSEVTATVEDATTITSGQYAAAGKDITFTQTPATGYTFKGWYNASSGGTAISSMASDNVYDDIAANISVYAQYTEDMHTITLAASGDGSAVTTTGSASSGSAGYVTGLAITATPDAGNRFIRWEVTSGTATIADDRAASTSITASTDATITAVFGSNWVVGGNAPFLGKWQMKDAISFANFTSSEGTITGYVDIPMNANVDTFEVKVYNHNGGVWYGCETTQQTLTYTAGNGDAKTFTRGGGYQNLKIVTAGKGNYRFTLTLSPSDTTLTVTYPTSYTVTYGTKTWKGVDGATAKETSTTGGSISSIKDPDDLDLATGKYIVEDGVVTFTHSSAASNYHFDGWYSDAACETAYVDDEGGAEIDDEEGTLSLTVSVDATVYAKFAEDMHEVALASTDGGHIEIGGATATSTKVGTATTSSLTAVPDAGYYFTSWTIDEGITDESGSAVSTTANPITIKTTGDEKTVTANFSADNKIYFDNTYSQWGSVWVYLFSNDAWWKDGQQGVHPGANIVAYAQMTKVEGEDNLYEYAYHTSERNLSFSHVAFCKDDQHNNTAFYGTEAAWRADWHSHLPVYVATAGYEETNNTKYHSGGYWRVHNPSAGENTYYYLDVFSGTATFSDGQYFKASGDGALVAEVSARLTTANTTYTFGVHSDAGGTNNQHYAESTTITNDNSDNYLKLYKYNSSWNISVQTAAEGIYTFILSMEYDSLRFSVIYPASVGDYRLTYSYGSPAKTRSSDIMKKKKTDAGAIHTSMYVDPTDATSQLIVERCTAITDGKPTWTARTTFNHASVASSFGSTKGVYEMDLTIGGTEGDASTLTNIKAYNGPFYIKTDCAPGGWANYTKNVLEENTINFDPSKSATFDYYLCKYIESTSTNVKCVIANDYNNQISDTLKDDAILNRGGIHETLPCASNVRFSYNSATNQLKRTYLLGSTASHSFLVLKPKEEGYVYREDNTTDLFSNETKFKDNGNWTYQLDAYAYASAIGGVWSDYPDFDPITRQNMVDTLTNILIGGDEKSTNPYHVRFIYDFKTNNLVAAWMPGGEEAETIDLQADFMMIRTGQDDISQLSFSGDAHVENAHRAYGAFQFNYDDMVGNMSSWNATSYALCMYYFSFPFDVNVSDIFGVGTMGSDWRIQKYNGAKRAQQGWFAGDGVTTFWEDVSAGETLNAYEGYSLLLNRVNFNDRENNVWTNISSGGAIYLIFPSSSTTIGTIATGTKTVPVPEHVCTIDRYFEQDKDKPLSQQRNHRYVDSNWNMVGAPLFQNLAATELTKGAKIIEDSLPIQYVYEWNSADNTLSARQALNDEFTFNAMTAYMVQYAGTVTFTGPAINPSAAPRRTPSNKHYTLELELTKDERFAGRAYVELRENAVDSFLLNEDMYMMRSSKTADIYTFAGGYDVAANVLSIGNHIIPVGVDVKTAGAYTFSMPNEFSGTVTLVDTYTQERTNLSLNDYEVTLQKGEINDRFYIEINIQEVITSLENVDGNNALNDNNAHKFIQNDQMYILKNGVVYDARGARVK